MTKKKGRTLEITVNEGAKAQIHWPQEAWKRNYDCVRLLVWTTR
jgi:hypothetical protein